ncbi:Probable pectinesterase/pectinesterase inhibitor 58 [Linum grandiflorum]
MSFKNTAGPEGYQAVALRLQAEKSAFIECEINTYQDSLYCHAHRQFYHNCIISGTIDFIFGDASVIIQNSLVIVRHPLPN